MADILPLKRNTPVTREAARIESLREERTRLEDECCDLRRQRDDLSRRVEDLRAFEREYRSRLLAYHEDAAAALRRGE